MRHDKLISADNCTVMVVDIQEAFVPHIRRLDKVIERTLMMIRAAQLLDVPIIVTEQYPKGLGRTVKPVREALGEIEYHEKLSFSCCQEPTVRTALAAAKREQLILVGIEAHVCIAQTALDAVAMGLQPYVAADAVSSRRQIDCRTALTRLGRLGVIITTTEAAIMEMTVSSRNPAFKQISKIVK